MNVIVIGDPHFKTADIDECQEMADAILDVVSVRKPDFIVVLGDTLDRFESIHVSPLRQATEFLFDLTKIAHVYLLIGNHDRPNPKTYKPNEHPFNSLKQWNNITVIEEAQRLTIGDHDFIFAPYYYPSLFDENIRPLLKSKPTAIFSHQEFKGVNMSGNMSTSSDIVIPEYNLVINGHIHEYQELDRLICVGTPRQIAFNESFPKTISWFTFTHEGYEHQRLELNITRKLTLTLSVKELMDYEPPLKTRVKIIVEGTIDEIKSLMKSFKNKWPNVKLMYQTLVPEIKDHPLRSIMKRSFKEHILDEIKGTELEETFHEIFSSV